MAILTGKEIIRPYIKKSAGYIKSLLSAKHVEMDDGKTLQTTVDEINNNLTDLTNNLLPFTIPFVVPAISSTSPYAQITLQFNRTMKNTEYCTFAFCQEPVSFNTPRHLGVSVVKKTLTSVQLTIWNESNENIVKAKWSLLIIPYSAT